jgi:hypothetical protein
MLQRGLRSPGAIALVVSAFTLVTVHAETNGSGGSQGTAPAKVERLIYGCANGNGEVRVLVPPPVDAVTDSSAAPKCTGTGEILIAWNQKGQPGPTGGPGPKGQDGPQGKEAVVDIKSLEAPFAVLIKPSLDDINRSLTELRQPLPAGVTGLAEFTSDSGSVEIPTGITHVLVEAWGGGGGGSGATNAADASQPCVGGAGGGAGGYVRAIVATPRPPALKPTDKLMLSVHVGGAGKGGSAGTNGDGGGSSTVSLGDTLLVLADGGNGGASAIQAAPGGTGGNGGMGSAPNARAIVRMGGSGLRGTTTSTARPPLVILPSAPSPTRTAPPPAPAAGLSPMERILRSLSLLEGRAPHSDLPPVAPRSGPIAAPQPATSDICGLGGAGGMPVRGSIDPLGTSGGRGGDQTSSESRSGEQGGPGYVLVLW